MMKPHPPASDFDAPNARHVFIRYWESPRPVLPSWIICRSCNPSRRRIARARPTLRVPGLAKVGAISLVYQQLHSAVRDGAFRKT
jgi:hypothetical protein